MEVYCNATYMTHRRDGTLYLPGSILPLSVPPVLLGRPDTKLLPFPDKHKNESQYRDSNDSDCHVHISRADPIDPR